MALLPLRQCMGTYPVKNLCAALLLLFCAGAAQAENTVGPTAQILCNKIATLAVGPTSSTQMVAAVTGQSIFICGWHVTNTGAAGTFTFTNGTGSNCGTGTATIIPPTNVTSSAPSADHISLATIQVPQSNAFCVTPSAATISVVIYYSQF